MTQDDDIDLMLADSGDIFTAASVDQPCLFMQHDEVVGQTSEYAGQVMLMGYVQIRASAFPSLKNDDPIRVNGTDYRAATVLVIQDGRMLQVTLGAPEAED